LCLSLIVTTNIYTVLCLQLALYLLSRHINNKEFNWIIWTWWWLCKLASQLCNQLPVSGLCFWNSFLAFWSALRCSSRICYGVASYVTHACFADEITIYRLIKSPKTAIYYSLTMILDKVGAPLTIDHLLFYRLTLKNLYNVFVTELKFMKLLQIVLHTWEICCTKTISGFSGLATVNNGFNET
jgi:hypothetical protein